MKPLMQIAIALLVILLTTAALAQTPVTVRLKDVAEVKGETVTIADLAQVDAAMPEVVKLVSGVTVAEAPQINESIRLSAADVRAALGDLPLDMSRIAIEGPEWVYVSRSGQRIAPEDLKRAVHDYVAEQTGLPDDDLILEFVRVPRSFAAPVGEVEYSVVPVGNSRLAGYLAFSVAVRIDGVEATTERVSVKIRLFRPVVVLERRAGQNEVITAEHVKIERREVTGTVGGYFMAIEDVAGKRATRSLSAGMLLTDVMVGEPLAVRRNNYVTIRARKGAVRVRTKGIALADACVGERVDVMNKDSKKVVHAHVVAPNEVELEL
ncbi:MAG: flagellar basal body P-ring formation protein FlgA [Verrucomicrobia bacterium]|nr:flagellar basal body P-ring formation protein FlgA [Verrucomicrobiota bacterium]